MNIKKAKSRYSDKTEKVQEYMSFIINQLNEQHDEVPDKFIISLDMLANMVDIMDKAYQQIENEGLTKDNKYFGKQQSSALTTYLNAQNYVAKLIAGFGLTPLSSSRIRQNKKETDVNSFLKQLTA